MLAFVERQLEADTPLVWRSHRPLAALMDDPGAHPPLASLAQDPVAVAGRDYELREQLLQAGPELGEVVAQRAVGAAHVAWDDGQELVWAAFPEDQEPMTAEITLARDVGGVRVTVYVWYFGGRF